MLGNIVLSEISINWSIAMSKKFVENACGAFMILPASVMRWDGIIKLKKGAAQAAQDAGAASGIFRGYVDMLGTAQSQLKTVKAGYMAIYTYLYEVSLPFERGRYLVPVCRMPEVLAKLAQMKKAADLSRDDFLVEYDRLVAIAQSQDMGAWKSEVKQKYPTAEEVRGRFGVTISAPKRLAPSDMSDINLPAELAGQIADANAAELSGQLDKAKACAIAQAEDQVKTLADQLDGGKRLHDSLISNSRQVARMLRDMTQGYDNDPRVLTLADMIDKAVKVNKTEIWRDNPKIRLDAQRTAEKAHKGLKAIRTAKPAVNKSPAKKTKAGDAVIGGVLADLL
jgi:hypothetical protein